MQRKEPDLNRFNEEKQINYIIVIYYFFNFNTESYTICTRVIQYLLYNIKKQKTTGNDFGRIPKRPTIY